MNLMGYQAKDAMDFAHEQPELVKRGAIEMGYRLAPMEVMYPDSFEAGREFEIHSAWVNRAVGRAMHDFHLEFALFDERKKVLARFDSGAIGTSRWTKGQNYEVDSRVNLTAPAGAYTLGLCLEDGTRAIAMPLMQERDGFYLIGTIHCR
jgi:hypothetical protein